MFVCFIDMLKQETNITPTRKRRMNLSNNSNIANLNGNTIKVEDTELDALCQDTEPMPSLRSLSNGSKKPHRTKLVKK